MMFPNINKKQGSLLALTKNRDSPLRGQSLFLQSLFSYLNILRSRLPLAHHRAMHETALHGRPCNAKHYDACDNEKEA